jgi:hypothetical protein
MDWVSGQNCPVQIARIMTLNMAPAEESQASLQIAGSSNRLCNNLPVAASPAQSPPVPANPRLGKQNLLYPDQPCVTRAPESLAVSCWTMWVFSEDAHTTTRRACPAYCAWYVDPAPCPAAFATRTDRERHAPCTSCVRRAAAAAAD